MKLGKNLIIAAAAAATVLVGPEAVVCQATSSSPRSSTSRTGGSSATLPSSTSVQTQSKSGRQGSPKDHVVPITIKGRHLYNEVTDEVFLVKGVDYQPGGEADAGSKDVLSDPKVCARDLSVFQTLGINCVRIYSINPNENHDECMSMFAASGIYLLLDVNSGEQHRHLNRYEPWTTYTEAYMENVFKVIEAFSNYNNTLGFFIGNEIVNNPQSAKSSPAYIKAVIRDVKQYMKNHLRRYIPLGYSAADDLDYRESLSNFLADGPEEEAVDFYGVNTYQWCGEQTFKSSGYDKLVAAYQDYAIPVVFSEYGCNEVKPRIFQETEAIFSDKMWNVFSGGLAYEYSQEDNDYGLVEVNQDGSIKLRGDYERLKQALGKVNSTVPYSKLSENGKRSDRKSQYQSSYENLMIAKTPESPATDLIKNGVENAQQGQYVAVSKLPTTCESKIIDASGKEVECNIKYSIQFDGTDLPPPRKQNNNTNNNNNNDKKRDEGNKTPARSGSSNSSSGQDNNTNGSTSSMYVDGGLLTLKLLLGIVVATAVLGL